MAKPKFKINFFDILAIALVTLGVLIGLASFRNKPYLGSSTVSVEIKISNSDTIAAILPKVETSKIVYFSGTKYPVRQKSYRAIQDSSGKVIDLYITLQGLGDISSKGSIFNGQRIYINEKAEIRADYQVQGYIVSFGNVINK